MAVVLVRMDFYSSQLCVYVCSYRIVFLVVESFINLLMISVGPELLVAVITLLNVGYKFSVLACFFFRLDLQYSPISLRFSDSCFINFFLISKSISKKTFSTAALQFRMSWLVMHYSGRISKPIVKSCVLL